MVEKLAETGHDVVVHARRPEVRDQFEELGIARTTDDLSEVFRGCRCRDRLRLRR
jgi:uncharacterized protein YbjT (DUF2867 family)